MRKISLKEAVERALEAGGSMEEIERQAQLLKRSAKSVPQKNMIVALQLMPYLNSADDWMRLAAALKAKRMAA